MSYAIEHSMRPPRRAIPRFDLVLVGVAGLLSALGVVMVYTATRNALLAAGADPHSYLIHQAIFVVLGVGVMVAVALFDYRQLEGVSTVMYAGMLLALLAVLSPIGSHALGSQRWFSLGIFQLQPSEFATLVLVIAIATYCSRRPEGLTLRDMVRLLLLTGVYMILVIKQPDLGTGIVLGVILVVMLAGAGLPGRYLLFLLIGTAIAVTIALKVGLLQHYQIQRLTSFISPNTASRSATYNVDQAKAAIGSGGLFGTGLFHGIATNLSYVPAQPTDFIFSAVGEQLGFVGCSILMFLYGVVAFRVLRVAQQAKDNFGRYLCVGVFALLVFSVVENVGMNLGIMPVAGIPLPFLSYGGSAIVDFFAAIGLVLSVHLRNTR